MKLPQSILLISLLGISSVVGVSLGSYIVHQQAPVVAEETLATPSSVASTPTPTPASPPQQLSIPTLHITASVEQVGLDQQNRMDVPHDPNDVGWYKYGPVPGQPGNAVIDGHLDSYTGPAIFYKLNTLRIGDTIAVTDQQGTIQQFKVARREVYPYDQVPLDQVFGTTDKRQLNLITCEGTFNKTQKNYSHRTVIYTEAVTS